MMQSEGHVLTCLAEDCSYNCRDECCASSVMVGLDHPACDMFTTGPVVESEGEPVVAKCLVSDCHYNSQLTCGAAGVTMHGHADHADCATYRH